MIERTTESKKGKNASGKKAGKTVVKGQKNKPAEATVKKKTEAGKKEGRRYVTGTATERGRAVENRKVEKRKYNKTKEKGKKEATLEERERQIREMRFEDMTFVELAMAKRAGRRPTPVPLKRYLEKEPGERLVDVRYGGYQLVAKADCLLHILSDEALNASVETVKVGNMKTTVVLRGAEKNGEMTGEGDRDGRLDRGAAEAAGDDPERVGQRCGVGGEGAADEHGR